jgi:phosphatidylethanolamine-binding protein (PEBP) family uncharacterized protein
MIITYSNNIKVISDNIINLSRNSTADTPTIDFGNKLDKNEYYTLIMYDPDAPNKIKNRVHVHWIINNIQENTKFDTLLDYTGPNPPPGSGVHRYIFKLYKQPNGLSESKYITLNKNNRSISLLDLLYQLRLTNEMEVSSVYFTCASSSISGGIKSKRRKIKSRRRKIKSRRRKSTR